MNQPVSSLNLPKNEIKKLEMKGFYNIEDVKKNKELIESRLNVSGLESALTAPKAKTALQLLKEESKFKYFKTNLTKLDNILRPIVIPGSITELCGLPGSGRTQICLHLAVGVKGEAVFIHTNKNLNPERLRELCQKYNANGDILQKLLCIEVTDCVELLASIQYLEHWLQDNSIKFVIIDSISWPLRQLIVTERLPVICRVFQTLRFLASRHQFAIIITNDLTTKVLGSESSTTSSFGDSFYHLINNRVLLSKNGGSHIAKLLKNVKGSQEAVSFQF